MSQKESLLERILRFIRREKLVGIYNLHNTRGYYEFWEGPNSHEISGCLDGKPLTPVRGKKYKFPEYSSILVCHPKHFADVTEICITDSYRHYLQERDRLLRINSRQK